MRIVLASALGVMVSLGQVAPAMAQNLNDVGRLLQDQVLGGRPNQSPEREREAYEQGRRDAERQRQEQAMREREQRREPGREYGRRDDERRDRGRYEATDRRERDLERERAERQRAYNDDQRYRQPGRY